VAGEMAKMAEESVMKSVMANENIGVKINRKYQ
jgi:hypothetical protein